MEELNCSKEEAEKVFKEYLDAYKDEDIYNDVCLFELHELKREKL